MKYYVVALFDKNSYDVLSPIQKKFSKKFRANRRSPIPHIALDIVESSNIDKITPIIQKVLTPYKKFKIEYTDNVSLSESLKSVSLNVVDRGYIKKIYTALTTNFINSGINVKFSADDNISISLATLNHINKDKNNYAAYTKEPDKEIINTLKIDRIEIWKLTTNKKEVCLQSFPLRTY